MPRPGAAPAAAAATATITTTITTAITGALEIELQGSERISELDLPAVRSWLEGLVRALDPTALTFAVKLVDDQEMRVLNRQYRGRDATTDVLSFPGEDTPEGRHLGDVAVSVPTARRQARDAGVTLAEELQTLLLHGVLHCLGHDHEVDDGEMEALERRLRPQWIASQSPSQSAWRSPSPTAWGKPT